MLFSSISFLLFMLVLFLVYWMIPHKFRWILLLLANIIFYGSYDKRYLLALFFATVISYITGLYIEEKSDGKKKKGIFAAGVILSLSLLLIFKYTNFVIGSGEKLLKLLSIPVDDITLKLIMPAGISFYTFQMVGYIVDVYKGKIKAERNFFKYTVFVTFFPNISSGPIERAGHFLPQLEIEKKFDYESCVYGMRLLLLGLLKKIVFADSMSKYVNNVFDHVQDFSGPALIFATILFTFQIYCDFSGYSDMAIGVAKLLGFDLPVNFNAPYYASSIKEFWARWHISLSTWFRDYVYIPLGGNRVSKLKRNRNLIITFLVSGLWHGANWTFVLWGGIHGLCQVIENTINEKIRHNNKIRNSEKIGNNEIIGNNEKAGKIDQNQKPVEKVIRIIITFVIVSFAWMFFRANSISDAIYILRNMFIPGSIAEAFARMSMSKFSILKTFLAILALMIFDYFNSKRDILANMSRINIVIRWLIYIALTVLIITLKIHNGTTQEFIYFKF